MKRTKRIRNFGENVSFAPAHRYRPRSEEEVLEILDRHRDGGIRAVGTLHSWSDAPVSDDVVIHMDRLDRIELTRDGDAGGDAGSVRVEAGGGCTVERLLRVLRRKAGSTLPAVGAVTKQTIAGAISTATHGSGRASMSHYIDAVRVAAFDPDSGRARIFEWSSGPELEAARCGLGCMGVILSVKFRAVPDFLVEETVVRYDSLAELLDDGRRHPLQEFVLMPWSWSWVAFNRREVAAASDGRASRLAPLYRAYNRVNIDVNLHLITKALLSRLGSPRRIRAFWKRVAPRIVLRGVTVVDRSTAMLTLQHQLFRHEEMEVFVPASRVHEAAELVRRIACVFAGVADEIPGPGPLDADGSEALAIARGSRGSYTHHYPIFFRRVLPDDAMISMTGGAEEPYCTMSFFTYRKPEDRDDFYRFAELVARVLVRRFEARLHWGKHFPLRHEEISHLYPRLEEFRAICRRTDPAGVFLNAFTERVLDFRPGVEASSPA